AVDRTRSTVADATQNRTLQSDPLRQPPLPVRAEREGGARDAESLRRYVVVGSVQPPHTAVAVSDAVIRSDQQPAAEETLHDIACRRSDLEVEVVERSRVRVTWLSRQTVLDAKREIPHLALHRFHDALIGEMRGIACPDLHFGKVCSATAWKDRVEAVSEH